MPMGNNVLSFLASKGRPQVLRTGAAHPLPDFSGCGRTHRTRSNGGPEMNALSMTNSQPWAKTSNFENLSVYFILKRLCNSDGNFLLTKNTLKCLMITRRFSKLPEHTTHPVYGIV